MTRDVRPRPQAVRVAVRVDASQAIGTGHVHRCLTLAAELASLPGVEVVFVSRALPGTQAPLIRSRGFQLLELPPPSPAASHQTCSGEGSAPPHAWWLATSWQQDAQQFIRAVIAADLVLVDHYAIDAAWHRVVADALACRIAVIDDLADRVHHAALVVDQSLHILPAHQRYQHVLDPADKTLLLAGPRFAMLRSDFFRWRSRVLAKTRASTSPSSSSASPAPSLPSSTLSSASASSLSSLSSSCDAAVTSRDPTDLRACKRRRRCQTPASDRSMRVLVFLGGVDQHQQLPRVLHVLAKVVRQLQPGRVAATAILGAANAHAADVAARFAPHSAWLECLHHVDDLPQRLAQADLCIGGGGCTMWERACLGVPSIVLSLADNQCGMSHAMHQHQCIWYIGHVNAWDPAALSSLLATLLAATPASQQMLAQQRHRCLSLVDGLGARRVQHALLPRGRVVVLLPEHGDSALAALAPALASCLAAAGHAVAVRVLPRLGHARCASQLADLVLVLAGHHIAADAAAADDALVTACVSHAGVVAVVDAIDPSMRNKLLSYRPPVGASVPQACLDLIHSIISLNSAGAEHATADTRSAGCEVLPALAYAPSAYPQHQHRHHVDQQAQAG